MNQLIEKEKLGRNWFKERNNIETSGMNISLFFDFLIKDTKISKKRIKDKLIFRKAELKG